VIDDGVVPILAAEPVIAEQTLALYDAILREAGGGR